MKSDFSDLKSILNADNYEQYPQEIFEPFGLVRTSEYISDYNESGVIDSFHVPSLTTKEKREETEKFSPSLQDNRFTPEEKEPKTH